MDSPVIGLLFGIQNGQDVSIFDGTEAIYDWNDGIVILNDIEINKKKSLWTAVFTSYGMLILFLCVNAYYAYTISAFLRAIRMVHCM